MNKINQLTQGVIIVLMTLLFVQCQKVDTVPPATEPLMMDDIVFNVASAAIIGISIGEEGHTGITLINGSGTQIKTLTMDVESFTAETIEGDYAYPSEEGKKLMDNWLSYYSVNDGTTTTSSNLQSGELSIQHHNGNKYTLDINLLMEDGVTFKGQYSGTFQVLFQNQ